MKKVVITGMGALTPIGNNIEEYWHALTNGVSGADVITQFDTTNFKTKFACELKNYNSNHSLTPKEIKKLDPFAQYAVTVANQAIEDAKLFSLPSSILEGVGVVWGSGIGGMKTIQGEVTNYAQNPSKPHFSPFFIPRLIGNMAPGYISIKNGFRGPSFTTISACASSSNALIDAYHLIKLGLADIMVTGGSEATITEAGIGGFNALRALSIRNDSPHTASRPFDKHRDGFVMGEGAGALVLESYEHAKKRKAKIYAELLGIGLSADAYHITAPHPEGKGVIAVMKKALQNAQLTPQDIDYINVHGTSTPLGDITEINAIQRVFGEHAYKLNMSSTKSMIGHLLGASGVAEAIASILTIQHNIIPPTINHCTPDEDIEGNLNLTLNYAQRRNIHTVMSNSFGFGGHNSSIIFRGI